MTLLHILIDTLAVLPSFDIPELDPDFSPKPIKAAQTLANQILAGGVIALLIAGLIISALLGFAGLDSRNKSKAWVALGICGVAAMVMASIVGFLTFFMNIPLF